LCHDARKHEYQIQQYLFSLLFASCYVKYDDISIRSAEQYQELTVNTLGSVLCVGLLLESCFSARATRNECRTNLHWVIHRIAAQLNLCDINSYPANVENMVSS
jgi:hypothetical protein